MYKTYKITPPSFTINAEVELPQSKSILNRLMVVNYLSGGLIKFNIHEPCEDVLLMYRIIENLNWFSKLNTPLVIDVKNSGTAARFLTSLLAVIPGHFLLTGSKRMEERPIRPLVKALCQVGADITYTDKNDKIPLLIRGKTLLEKETDIDTSKSSQFLSSLLLIAPFLPAGLKINVISGEILNPYVAMTIELLRLLGVEIEINKNSILMEKTLINENSVDVESDWSAAAFWYEIVALQKNAKVTLKGLKKESWQGDSVLPLIYKKFGVETSFLHDGIFIRNIGPVTQKYIVDLLENPDLAVPVIASCAALNIPCELTGLQNLKHKESDRLKVISEILNNAGKKVCYDKGRLSMQKGKLLITKAIKTYDDHRIAMSVAPFALVCDEVEIENPDVVGKSYPMYWKDLQRAGFDIIR